MTLSQNAASGIIKDNIFFTELSIAFCRMIAGMVCMTTDNIIK